MNANTLSRRHAFKIAGLAGAAVALRGASAPAQDAATKPLPQGAGFYRTHVGEFEVTIVSDGAFAVGDVHPTFGANASKEAVEQVLNDSFIDPKSVMGQVSILAIRKPGGPITIVDTGAGKLFGALTGFARQNLLNAGVKLEDVTTVLLSHIHPDHAGGVVTDDGKKVFPNARHLVHRLEKEYWAGPTPDLSKSSAPEPLKAMVTGSAKKILAAADDWLETFEDAGGEIAPGITAVRSGGHTPGHCTVRIESGGELLFYVGDLIVQSVIVPAHPEWLVAFDCDGLAAAGVRQKLFSDLAANRTRICGSHLPFPSLGHLRAKDKGYEYVAAPWKWA